MRKLTSVEGDAGRSAPKCGPCIRNSPVQFDANNGPFDNLLLCHGVLELLLILVATAAGLRSIDSYSVEFATPSLD